MHQRLVYLLLRGLVLLTRPGVVPLHRPKNPARSDHLGPVELPGRRLLARVIEKLGGLVLGGRGELGSGEWREVGLRRGLVFWRFIHD